MAKGSSYCFSEIDDIPEPRAPDAPECKAKSECKDPHVCCQYNYQTTIGSKTVLGSKLGCLARDDEQCLQEYVHVITDPAPLADKTCSASEKCPDRYKCCTYDKALLSGTVSEDIGQGCFSRHNVRCIEEIPFEPTPPKPPIECTLNKECSGGQGCCVYQTTVERDGKKFDEMATGCMMFSDERCLEQYDDTPIDPSNPDQPVDPTQPSHHFPVWAIVLSVLALIVVVAAFVFYRSRSSASRRAVSRSFMNKRANLIHNNQMGNEVNRSQSDSM